MKSSALFKSLLRCLAGCLVIVGHIASPSLSLAAPAPLASQVASLDRDKVLEQLCQWITPTPVIDSAKIFEDSFRKQVPDSLLVQIFSEIAKDGACQGLADVSEWQSTLASNTVGFRLATSAMPLVALFQIRFSPETGKITGLLYRGTSLAPRHLNVKETRVVARDGVQLRTFIFKTNGAAPAPVVMTRTPYFTMNGELAFEAALSVATYFVQRGYVFVYQAVRGTGGSEGEPLLFNPQEIQDGADTVAWIVKQPFTNGKVAAVGTSYEGLTAAAAGVENPKGLALVIAGAGPTDSRTGTFYINGLLNLHLLDYARYFTKGLGVPFTERVLEKKISQNLAQNLDLHSYDETLFGASIPEWDRWVDAASDPNHSFWRERSFIGRLPEIAVPTYHIAGTGFDGNMPDTINNFLEIEARSPHRLKHSLILGHWGHGNNTPANHNGSNVAPFVAERFDSILAHYLKGETSPYVTEARVRMQSHFKKDFLGFNAFPFTLRSQPTFQPLTLFFGANERGLTLESKRDGDESASEYVYRPQEAKAASLEFKYHATRDLFLNGPLQLDLFLEIDVPQTDLIVNMYKLDVKGEQQFFTTCAAAGRLLHAEMIRFTNSICPVFAKIAKGEKLVLQVMSNGFPTIARNSNNELSQAYSGSPREARVRLLHDDAHPSRVTLTLEANPSNEMPRAIENRPLELRGHLPLSESLPFSEK